MSRGQHRKPRQPRRHWLTRLIGWPLIRAAEAAHDDRPEWDDLSWPHDSRQAITQDHRPDALDQLVARFEALGRYLPTMPATFDRLADWHPYPLAVAA